MNDLKRRHVGVGDNVSDMFETRGVLARLTTQRRRSLSDISPLTPTVAIKCTAIKHPVIRLSFVIFDFWAL